MKHQHIQRVGIHLMVAPHPGAWIETGPEPRAPLCGVSPPTRGRGLKPWTRNTIRRTTTSPPTRGRGLKLLLLYVIQS